MRRYGWIWVILLFLIAGFLSRHGTSAIATGEGWYPIMNIPPGSIIQEKDIAEGKVVIHQNEADQLAGKEEIIGKIALYGIKTGYGITKNELQIPNHEYHEVSIPIKLETSTRPEQLKVAAIWVDYDQKRFPSKPPELIYDNAAVIDLINNRGISIFEEKTTQKVPVTADLYVPKEMIPIIKAKGQLGELFLTNPYYLPEYREVGEK